MIQDLRIARQVSQLLLYALSERIAELTGDVHMLPFRLPVRDIQRAYSYAVGD